MCQRRIEALGIAQCLDLKAVRMISFADDRHRLHVRLHRADEIRECTESELAAQGEGVSQVERIFITEGDKQ
jgi:hypothetical protein